MLLVSESPVQVHSSHHTEGSTQRNSSYTQANLGYFIFDICPGCHKSRMASIPQGGYATWKVHRSMMRDLSHECTTITVKKNESEKSTPPLYHFPQGNKKFLDHPPAKYNSKMMNSIWGLYNRYSVHNLKKITDGDDAQTLGVQQLSAAVTPTSTLSSVALKGGLMNGPQALVTWEALVCGHTY